MEGCIKDQGNGSRCILYMMIVVFVFGGAAGLLWGVFHWEYAAFISLLGLPLLSILWGKGIEEGFK